VKTGAVVELALDVVTGATGWEGEVVAGFRGEDDEAEAEGEEGEWTALGCVTTGLVAMADAVVMVEFLYGALVGMAAILVFELLVVDADGVPAEGFALAVVDGKMLDCEADTASAINAGPGIV
jgi:hypothetical protein